MPPSHPYIQMVKDAGSGKGASYPLDLGRVKQLIATGTLIDKRNPTVLAVGDGMIVKFGSDIWRSEASAMSLILEQTPLPIPRLISYISKPTANGRAISRNGYLVTETMPGVTLQSVLGGLKQSHIKTLAKELRGVVAELRRLDRPQTWGMVDTEGTYHGGFFSRFFSQEPCRPCSPHALRDIVGYLIEQLPDHRRELFEPGGIWAHQIQALFVEHDSVFSHSDLRPESILVDPTTFRITGIVNWAYAGWYPRFWDHFVAARAKYHYDEKDYAHWEDIFTKAFESYPAEAAAFDLLISDVQFFVLPDYTVTTYVNVD